MKNSWDIRNNSFDSRDFARFSITFKWPWKFVIISKSAKKTTLNDWITLKLVRKKCHLKSNVSAKFSDNLISYSKDIMIFKRTNSLKYSVEYVSTFSTNFEKHYIYFSILKYVCAKFQLKQTSFLQIYYHNLSEVSCIQRSMTRYMNATRIRAYFEALDKSNTWWMSLEDTTYLLWQLGQKWHNILW
jgi:hypothetical protein